MTEGFDDLDAPVMRVTDVDVPLPYAANLEKMALIKASRGGRGGEGRLLSLSDGSIRDRLTALEAAPARCPTALSNSLEPRPGIRRRRGDDVRPEARCNPHGLVARAAGGTRRGYRAGGEPRLRAVRRQLVPARNQRAGADEAGRCLAAACSSRSPGAKAQRGDCDSGAGCCSASAPTS